MMRSTGRPITWSRFPATARSGWFGFAILLGLAAFETGAQAENRFFIDPQTLPAGAESREIIIRADNDQDIVAFQIAFKFDATKIQVTGIEVTGNAAGAAFPAPDAPLETFLHGSEVFYGVLMSLNNFDPTRVIPAGTGRNLVKVTFRVIAACDGESAIDISDQLSNQLWRNAMTVPPGSTIRAPALTFQDGTLTFVNDLSQFQGRFEVLKGQAARAKTGLWSFGLNKATFDPGFEIPADRAGQVLVGLEVDGQPYLDDPALRTIAFKTDKKTGNLSKILVKQGKDKVTIDLKKDLVKLALKNIPADKFNPLPGEAPVSIDLSLSSEDTLFQTISRVTGSLQSNLMQQSVKKVLLEPQAGAVALDAKPCD